MTTITDIASKAGVSEMTVSRILNGNADYRRPTYRKRAEKIRLLADRMGYRPNSAARAARTGHFNAISLLLSTINRRSKLPAPLLEGIHDALEQREQSLNLVRLPDENLVSEGGIPRLLREKSSDGLLIDFIFEIPPAMIDIVERYAVPSIWLNIKRENNAVGPNDFEAGLVATRQLLEAGHRRIVYVSHNLTGETPHYSVLDRLAGYETAMRQAGMTPLSSVYRPLKYSFHEMMLQWLRSPDRPTAVVAYSPNMVSSVLLAAMAAGLRFPEDLSMVTFGDEPFGMLCPIDTYIVPLTQVGSTAVEMLNHRIDTGENLPSQYLKFKHHPGNSVVPVTPSVF